MAISLGRNSVISISGIGTLGRVLSGSLSWSSPILDVTTMGGSARDYAALSHREYTLTADCLIDAQDAAQDALRSALASRNQVYPYIYPQGNVSGTTRWYGWMHVETSSVEAGSDGAVRCQFVMRASRGLTEGPVP